MSSFSNPPDRINRDKLPFGIEGWPWCHQCGAWVEQIDVDHVAVPEVDYVRGYPHMRYRCGDVVLTIRCHGEVWKVSRSQGPLSPQELRIR